MQALPSSVAEAGMLSLPSELLVLLIDYIHNIEDYINLISTCRNLRGTLHPASPKAVLRLAAAQSNTFFRPSPWFLVAATARELGHWARLNGANEKQLATTLQEGIDGLFDLCFEHCGLTLERIRELHLMRFSIINPVTDIVDKCVGHQWYATPDFWDGGVSDAYTISSEPTELLFQLAIYGELFGPDFEAFLNQDTQVRGLSVETRLEYIKYCLPDVAAYDCQNSAADVRLEDGSIDPRRAVKTTGPYAKRAEERVYATGQSNVALVWVLKSSRWRPYWKEAREQAGLDFTQGTFVDPWWYYVSEEDEDRDACWRQRMWESVILCQGLDGLGMMRTELRALWTEKIGQWRERIAAMEREPRWIRVGRQATLEYPFLLGDLRICGSGYVLGT
jgi:hypothetical protein